MNRSVIGYLALPAGVTAVLGGIHLSHDTTAVGLLTILVGIALVFVAFRALRAPTPEPSERVEPGATPTAIEQAPHTPPPQ